MNSLTSFLLTRIEESASSLVKEAEVEYHGKKFPGYNKPISSDKKDKKMMVLAKKGDQVKLVHFGQKGYQHNYSPEAKQNYLTRSAGIRNKSGELTKDDPFSPNYWARKVLWPKGETGHGHNGPINTEVRSKGEGEKKAELTDFLEKGAEDLSARLARPMAGAVAGLAGLGLLAAFPPTPRWKRYERKHSKAVHTPHTTSDGEKMATVPAWLKNPTLIGALTGSGLGGATGALSSDKGHKTKGALRGAALGGLAGGVAGSSLGKLRDKMLVKNFEKYGPSSARDQKYIDYLWNAKERGQHLDAAIEHVRRDKAQLADIFAQANKSVDRLTGGGAAAAGLGLGVLGGRLEKQKGEKQAGALLSTLVGRKEDERLAAALKLAEADMAPKKKWSWKGFREGIRDEGLPMAGLVGGAYLGNRLLPGGTGAVYGSGIGYGGGALSNLGIEHMMHKKQQSKTASDSSPASYIPGAVGATLGAGIAGGLTKDEKNKGRNMLAGSAIGYGLADAGMLARELIKKRMAK